MNFSQTLHQHNIAQEHLSDKQRDFENRRRRARAENSQNTEIPPTTDETNQAAITCKIFFFSFQSMKNSNREETETGEEEE
jgi:hypothetical protein